MKACGIFQLLFCVEKAIGYSYNLAKRSLQLLSQYRKLYSTTLSFLHNFLLLKTPETFSLNFIVPDEMLMAFCYRLSVHVWWCTVNFACNLTVVYKSDMAAVIDTVSVFT